MGGEAGGEAKRCRGEGPLCVRVPGRRSAPAGRARGCRAACAERAWSAGRGKAGAAAPRRGGQEHPQRRSPTSTVRCSVPPGAARALGPRRRPHWPGSVRPGRGEAAAAPPKDCSRRAPLPRTALRLRGVVVPSFLGPNLQAGRSLPSGASPGPAKPRRVPGTVPSPEQPHSLGGVPVSTKTGRLFPTLEVRQRPRVFRVWMDAKSCRALRQAPASLLAVPSLF